MTIVLKSPVRLVASCASRVEFPIGQKSFQGAQLARTLPRVRSQVPQIRFQMRWSAGVRRMVLNILSVSTMSIVITDQGHKRLKRLKYILKNGNENDLNDLDLKLGFLLSLEEMENIV